MARFFGKERPKAWICNNCNKGKHDKCSGTRLISNHDNLGHKQACSCYVVIHDKD